MSSKRLSQPNRDFSVNHKNFQSTTRLSSQHKTFQSTKRLFSPPRDFSVNQETFSQPRDFSVNHETFQSTKRLFSQPRDFSVNHETFQSTTRLFSQPQDFQSRLPSTEVLGGLPSPLPLASIPLHSSRTGLSQAGGGGSKHSRERGGTLSDTPKENEEKKNQMRKR